MHPQLQMSTIVLNYEVQPNKCWCCLMDILQNSELDNISWDLVHIMGGNHSFSHMWSPQCQ